MTRSSAAADAAAAAGGVQAVLDLADDVTAAVLGQGEGEGEVEDEVFGDRDSGRYLVRFSWTPVVRHRLVTGSASTDDPALARYWAGRGRRKPPLGPFLLRLLQSQKGRCPGCDGLLLHADREPQSPDEWEQWLKGLRRAIRRTAVASPNAPPDGTARCLMHASCAKRRNATHAASPAHLPPTPSELA